ncbi:hypothetical protein G3580_18230 [Nitrogeniibacter mangrovi]|uniref:Uncharacterized protein n=1 Tax=Nitrogeniibacter mangrovi TaxID=2016596 RepID=A0A6C1B6L7_9RHOO|nr:hypothetical protein [Nitrogeniibacter mangrovi]QID19382.1 hypothetical protein G3580_18230 [Nitrogeniibacter mangrovi]
MPLIHAIEVSNFMNHTRRLPWSPDWRFERFLLGGFHAALNFPNGRGKSTMVLALFAMLTWHRNSLANIRSMHCAPPSDPAFTHFRIEITKRNARQEDLLMDQLGPSDGDHMVFGIYGNAGDGAQWDFYAYNGTFDDCPIAHRRDRTVKLVSKNDFVTALQEQNGIFPASTRERRFEEWRRLVGENFDMSSLQQQLTYQLAKGAEGSSTYFDVGGRRGENYSEALFYKHLAPELLSEVMGSYAEEGEKGIEDTIYEKSRSVVVALRRTRQVKRDLDAAELILKRFESLNAMAEKMREARAAVEEHRQMLSVDLKALEDVLVTDPVPGVPRAPSPSDPRFYEHFVLQNGSWWLTDRGLASFSGEEPRAVNQRAERNSIHPTTASSSQVIEITCDNSSPTARRPGPKSKLYNRDAALELIGRTAAFRGDWTTETALRAISDGFKWVQLTCDTNPVRRRLRTIEAKIAQNKETIAGHDATEVTQKRLKKEAEDEQSRYETGSSVLDAMHRRGIFTQDELDDPRATGQQVKADAAAAETALNEHDRVVATQTPVFEEWAAFTAMHPDAVPAELASALERADKEAAEQFQRVGQSLELARKELATREAEHEASVKAFREMSDQLNSVELHAKEAKGYEGIFEGESPHGLVEAVTREMEENASSMGDCRVELAKIEGDIQAIATFDEQHPGIAPAAWLSERDARKKALSGLRAALHKDIDRSRADQANARRELPAAAGFHALFANENTQGLEKSVTAAADAARSNLARDRQALAKIEDDEVAIQRFAARVPEMTPGAWLSSRDIRRQELQREKEEASRVIAELHTQRRTLDIAPVAPGEIARRVGQIAGSGCRPLYEFVQSLGLSQDRSSAVLTLFSALLFSPVFDDRHMAAAAARRLAEQKVEAVVFEAVALKSFCERTEIRLDEGIARSLFTGVTTRAVECLLDPGLVEREKRELDAQIGQTQRRLDEALAGLALLAEDDDLVFDAERARRAIGDGIPAQAELLRTKINQLEADMPRHEARSSQEALASIRAMRGLEQLFGLAAGAEWGPFEMAIERLEATIEQLETELQEVSDAEEALEQRVELEAIARQAASAIEREVPAVQTRLVAVLEQCREAEPRLKRRASPEAIAMIKAALELERLLAGKSIEALRELSETRRQLEAGAKEARQVAKSSATDLEQAKDDAGAAANNARKDWLEQSGPLRRIQAFLDDPNYGREFMQGAKLHREVLVQQRDRAQMRDQFDFEAAAMFVSSDGAQQLADISRRLEGITAKLSDIEGERKDLQAEINAMECEKAGLVEARFKIDESILGFRRAHRDLSDVLGEPAQVSLADLEGRALYNYAKEWRSGIDLNELGDEMRQFCDEVSGAESADLQRRLSDTQKTLQSSRQQLEKDIDALLTDPFAKLPDVARVQLEQAKMAPDVILAMLDASRESFAENKKANTLAGEYLDKERNGLGEWLANFTLRLPSNLKTLKRVFAPKTDGRTGTQQAGFDIDATTIDAEGMRALLEEVISMVEEIEGSETLQDTMSEVVLSKVRVGQRERIREMFYKRVVIKPRIRLVLPAMSSRPLEMQPNMASSGQGVAITFLWIRKLAEFINEREIRRETVDSAKRKRLRDKMTSFTILDGAFSHLSDKKLIDSTLAGIEESIGNFQLIITGHDPAYDNDFTRFPALVMAREMSGRYMRSSSYHHRVSETDENGHAGIATFHAIQLPAAATL